jgi:L,D-transpeptidase catalytic domain
VRLRRAGPKASEPLRMRRVPTVRGGWKARIALALVAACWVSLPAATGADDSLPAATGADDSLPAADGDGIVSALASIATKLTAAGVSASSGGSAASSDGSAPARAAPVRPTPAPERRAPRPRRLAVVRGDLALSDRPGGPPALRIGPTTEFGSPRVLGVAARRGDWLGVVATERPNNRLAWVRRNSPGLNLRRTGWSLHAELSDRTLTLRKDGRRVHRLAVAIGRPGSETPTGRFAVTDKLSGSQFGPYYGCCILALSGHQPKTPPGWTGGDRLAIHGTDAPSTIGMAASAGCMRASDADLRALMAKVPLGTLVFIRP